MVIVGRIRYLKKDDHMKLRIVLWGCVVLGVLSAGLVLPLMASTGIAAAPASEPRYAPAAPASSATHTVNVISDTILTSNCTGGAGSCSLRGAVSERRRGHGHAVPRSATPRATAGRSTPAAISSLTYTIR
jgi:hypothetical protein